jgi:acetolactate synthase regulatory subunit
MENKTLSEAAEIEATKYAVEIKGIPEIYMEQTLNEDKREGFIACATYMAEIKDAKMAAQIEINSALLRRISLLEKELEKKNG